MANSEIDVKNATQRYSVAPLNVDPLVESTHKFSEAWKTSTFEWGVLYSLLWLLRGGVGDKQDIGRRGYTLSLPSEFNRASTTIFSKKCASDPQSHFRYLRMPKERFDCLFFSHFQSPECIVSSPICHKKDHLIG